MLITQGSLVRAQLDPPKIPMSGEKDPGGLAQLGEHLLCKQGVVGSIPHPPSKTAPKSATIEGFPIQKQSASDCFCIEIHLNRLFFKNS